MAKSKSMLKTQVNDASVAGFVKSIPDNAQRADCQALVKMMTKATGQKPRMWGTAMIGFGTCHYKGRSGREGEWFLVGLAPRKGSLTVSIMTGFDVHPTLMKKLGKYTTGKACLHVKKLSDVDQSVLRTLVSRGYKMMKQWAAERERNEAS